MTEPQISPLAKRLAEENSIDWRLIEGTGPESRVIERDILTYLARIMSGEIDPPALPDASEPPVLGSSGSLPDLGQISNLAAASAGMAKEGIDLGSLLASGAALTQTPVQSFSQQAVSHEEPVLLEQSEPVPHDAFTHDFGASTGSASANAASPELSFEEPPAYVPPAPATSLSGLEEITFGDLSMGASEPVSFGAMNAAPETMPSADLSAVELPAMAAPVPHEAPIDHGFMDAARTHAEPMDIPAVQLEDVATSAPAFNFPPPASVADSGVEFEIDLDDLDDLPDAPLEVAADHAPAAFGMPAVAEPHAVVSEPYSASEPHEQQDLVLEIDSTHDHAPVAAAHEDHAFHDDLLIDETAPAQTGLALGSLSNDFNAALEPAPAAHDGFAEPHTAHSNWLNPDVHAAGSAAAEASLLSELQSPEFSDAPHPDAMHAPALLPDAMPAHETPSHAANLEMDDFEIDLDDAEDAPANADLGHTDLGDAAPAYVAPTEFATPSFEAAAPANLESPAIETLAPLAAVGAVAAVTHNDAAHFSSTGPSSSGTHSPVASGFYQGFAVRRHFDASALTTMQSQLVIALGGREVALGVFLARAAQRNLHMLNTTDRVTLTRLGDRLEALSAPGLHHSFIEAVQSVLNAETGNLEGLLVLDASHLGADDLVLPGEHPVLALNVSGDHGQLSLAGDLPAAKAVAFLGAVASALEVPVSLVI